MDLRLPIFVASLALACAALATGTGPTLPEKTREHPLDNREPRQEIIDQDGSQHQPRPPTLEAPPEIPSAEPIERRPKPDPERRGSEASGNPTLAS